MNSLKNWKMLDQKITLKQAKSEAKRIVKWICKEFGFDDFYNHGEDDGWFLYFDVSGWSGDLYLSSTVRFSKIDSEPEINVSSIVTTNEAFDKLKKLADKRKFKFKIHLT